MQSLNCIPCNLIKGGRARMMRAYARARDLDDIRSSSLRRMGDPVSVENPAVRWHGRRAPVLVPGQGWVLAMLAMLAPKGALRVAARGCGPGAKPRRPGPALRAGAGQRGRDERRPALSTRHGFQPHRVEQKAA